MLITLTMLILNSEKAPLVLLFFAYFPLRFKLIRCFLSATKALADENCILPRLHVFVVAWTAVILWLGSFLGDIIIV